MESSPPVILFDGVCNLCAGIVKFVIRRDTKARFRFAPLQSGAARNLLASRGVPPPDADSLVLLEAGTCSVESTAALNIVRRLRWPWPLLYVFILVPKPIRDALYRWIARNRNRWFGKSEVCWAPGPEWKERFL